MDLSDPPLHRDLQWYYREMNAGLDPWPEHRPGCIIPLWTPQHGAFLVDPYSGTRILKIPANWALTNG